jgi:hypothetical protein
MIEVWPTTKSVNDVHVLLRFMHLYQRFIEKYAKIPCLISDLLNTTFKLKLELRSDTKLAFKRLKNTFSEAPILQHFYLAEAIVLQTNVRGFALAGIFNQYNGYSILLPVNFVLQRCFAAAQNYDPYHCELLAIMEMMKQWQHYLMGE